MPEICVSDKRLFEENVMLAAIFPTRV